MGHQQLLCSLGAGALAGLAVDDPFALDHNPPFQQLAGVTPQPLRAGGGVDGSSDESNIAMAKIQQMLGCQLCAKEVICADKVKVRISHRPDHHDGRDLAAFQRFKKQARRLSGGTQHHTAGAVLQQRVDKFLLPVGRFFAVGQKQHQLVTLHFLAQPGGHLRIKRIGDVVQ
ncbi:hypothetical protein D3C87_1468010 [compost metagenome]